LRRLLSERGSIWISIDDNEPANLRLLMDDIFGARNFIATVIRQKVFSPQNTAIHFSEDHDFIMVMHIMPMSGVPNFYHDRMLRMIDIPILIMIREVHRPLATFQQEMSIA